MRGFAALAVVAAVLGRGQVTFIDTDAGRAVRVAALPGEGAAIFAAPDGGVLVPLASRDETAVIAQDGKVGRWPGRLFPLFFDEPDQLFAVLPGYVATLSYPERLPIGRNEVAGLAAVRRAACSRDGRLVALLPLPPFPAQLVLVATGDAGGSSPVRLSCEPSAVAVAPSSGWVTVGSGDGTLRLIAFGGKEPLATIALGGAVRAVLPTTDGRGVLVGVDDGARGAVVGVRVDPTSSRPLRQRFRVGLPSAPLALAGAGPELLAVTDDSMFVLDRGGKRVRLRVATPGALDLAALPTKASSTLPEWSDR